jgi:hypothetical protein
MRIARRFNAGVLAKDEQVPKGRPKMTPVRLFQPSLGTLIMISASPALKRRAMCA